MFNTVYKAKYNVFIDCGYKVTELTFTIKYLIIFCVMSNLKILLFLFYWLYHKIRLLAFKQRTLHMKHLSK